MIGNCSKLITFQITQNFLSCPYKDSVVPFIAIKGPINEANDMITLITLLGQNSSIPYVLALVCSINGIGRNQFDLALELILDVL